MYVKKSEYEIVVGGKVDSRGNVHQQKLLGTKRQEYNKAIALALCLLFKMLFVCDSENG